MKRFLATFLVLVMVLSTLVVPTSALSIRSDYLCTVSADETTVDVGDIITVTVNLEENAKLGVLTLDLVYDDTRFEVVSGSAKTYGIFPDSNNIKWEHVNEKHSSNKVRYTAASSNYTKKTGSLLSVQFKAIESGNTGFSIDVIEAVDENLYDVTVEWESLGVFVNSELFADSVVFVELDRGCFDALTFIPEYSACYSIDTFYLDDSDENTDPMITVYDSQGYEIESNDDYNNYDLNAAVCFYADADETYTVVVSNANDDSAKAIFGFYFMLECNDFDGDYFCDGCCYNFCDCKCHDGGFFWIIKNFFNRLFRINEYCQCDMWHW